MHVVRFLLCKTTIYCANLQFAYDYFSTIFSILLFPLYPPSILNNLDRLLLYHSGRTYGRLITRLECDPFVSHAFFSFLMVFQGTIFFNSTFAHHSLILHTVQVVCSQNRAKAPMGFVLIAAAFVTRHAFAQYSWAFVYIMPPFKLRCCVSCASLPRYASLLVVCTWKRGLCSVLLNNKALHSTRNAKWGRRATNFYEWVLYRGQCRGHFLGLEKFSWVKYEKIAK